MHQAWRNFLQPGFFLRTCRKKSMRVCLCVYIRVRFFLKEKDYLCNIETADNNN